MKPIIQRLKERKPLVSDGAWGTLLQKAGLQPGECPELWCIEHRDVVLSIAKSYIDAGSDLIKTNSFGCTSFKLEHFGLADRVAELNEAAAAISREACGDDHNVIASVGPTGKMLLMGDVSESQLYDAFSEQLVALEKGGADACCIETFAAIDEATLAVKAAKENTSLEIICTFTFEKTLQGGFRTMMGVSPEDMAEALLQSGADIIGSNCGNGMNQMVDIVKAIRAAAPTAPIAIHGNAGLPVLVDGKDTFPESPDETARQAIGVVAAGADIVGGCCGTTPEHIRAMFTALQQ
jgi:5-methyltetrahydrofolate--homocysteine methyltransferase